MIGAIIGDIAGSRFEFNNYRNTDFEFFATQSEFTDDTVCTVAVADYLLSAGTADKEEPRPFAGLLKKWCLTYPDESYGGNFQRWIHSSDPAPPPYNSFGNGAAMRISPVGDFFDTKEETMQYADIVTGVTHNHPEGLKGARAVAHAMLLAGKGTTKEEIKSTITSQYGYDLSSTCREIREVNQFDETCQVTVPQAIIAFLESTNFETAVRLAVSIGGDSDTIAAIAGGLAETFYKEIPSNIIHDAMDRLPEDITGVVKAFYKKIKEKDPETFGKIYNLIVTGS